jgi:hypothetical protein
MTHQEFDYLQYCKETEQDVQDADCQYDGDDNLDDLDDGMDGDHDSAMASAGWGTDEDYTMWDDIEF